MGLVQLRKGFRVTLPAQIRHKLGLKEGDFVTAELEGDKIVLRPKRLKRKGQEWFWTEAWQAAEREAEADLQAGRVHKFKTVEEAIAFLHERAAQSRE